MEPLSALEQIEAYRRLFTDANFWMPYVQEVCRRHVLSPAGPVSVGVPGTYPAFIVGDQWLVKFFGRLFEGGQSFAAEREAGRLVSLDPAIPTAQIRAAGELGGPGWPWPYLVFAYIPGKSLGERIEQVSPQDWLRIAREMGGLVRRLHALPLAGSPVFPDHYTDYLEFLGAQRAACQRNQRGWGTLPAHLLAQLERFVPPPDQLVGLHRPPHLIHADLTLDHLLGKVINGRWQTLALIDFGDAMTGDLLYELAALHLDLFRADRRLLGAFLDSYELPLEERVDLPRRALAMALLHQFNVLACLPGQMLAADSLEELAQRIWGLP